jgi:hypothetical protein
MKGKTERNAAEDVHILLIHETRISEMWFGL